MPAIVNRTFAEAVAANLSGLTGDTFAAAPAFRIGPDFLPYYYAPRDGEPPEIEQAEERGYWLIYSQGAAFAVNPSNDYAQRGRIYYSAELPMSPEGWQALPMSRNILAYNEARADSGTVAGNCEPKRLASTLAKRLPTVRDYTRRALAYYQGERDRFDAEANAGRVLALASGMNEAQAAEATDKTRPYYRPSINLSPEGNAYGTAEFGDGIIRLELRSLPLDKAARIVAVFCDTEKGA